MIKLYYMTLICSLIFDFVPRDGMRWVKATLFGQQRCSGQYFNTEFRKCLGELEKWIWGLSDRVSKSEGYHGWSFIIVSYVHKHIFQSRTVLLGYAVPFSDIPIQTILGHISFFSYRFQPLFSVDEGRRTSTHVRYMPAAGVHFSIVRDGPCADEVPSRGTRV